MANSIFNMLWHGEIIRCLNWQSQLVHCDNWCFSACDKHRVINYYMSDIIGLKKSNLKVQSVTVFCVLQLGDLVGGWVPLCCSLRVLCWVFLEEYPYDWMVMGSLVVEPVWLLTKGVCPLRHFMLLLCYCCDIVKLLFMYTFTFLSKLKI